MIYDITRTVADTTAVWPETTGFSLTKEMDLDQGDFVNLVKISLTPHTGTHADAYYHYEKDGLRIGKMPLEAYIGRARVVTVTRKDGALTPDDFAHVDLTGGERLLVHSHVSDLPDTEFPMPFPYVSAEFIRYLAGLGYKLIGLDSPSMDAFDSKDLEGHHALAETGMVNIELLNLNGVPDGDYELVALPLKLDAACGSPVRAILRPLS